MNRQDVLSSRLVKLSWPVPLAYALSLFCLISYALAVPRPVVLMHGMGDSGNSDG